MPVHSTPRLLLASMLVGAMALGGCARQISPDVHEGRAVGETLVTYMATVEHVRAVDIQENDQLERGGAGKLIGAVAGGFIGSIFGEGTGKAAAVTAGVILGSIAGAVTEQELKRQPALEYIVRTEDGQFVTIIQGYGGERIAPGQRVYVQEGYSGRSRVIPI